MEAFRPPERLLTTEWAEKYRRLSRESASEDGRYSASRAPFQRGMQDAVHERGINRVVIVTCTQVGKSTAIENVFGRYSHLEPSPMIWMLPTVDKAQEFSKERIDPLVRDTPILTPLFGGKKTRDSSNTILTKHIKGGGHLALVGANSPSGVASRPRRIAFVDETDRMKASAGTEGPPIKLLEERLENYWNSFMMLTSTPGDIQTSEIWRWWELSDQRYFFVPCMRCGSMIVLEYAQFSWETEDDVVIPESVHYECQECSGRIENSDQPAMLDAGEWIPTKPTRNIAGFHLWKIYSPWVKWLSIAEKRVAAGSDPDRLRVFWNTSLGLPWEEKGITVDYQVLMERREDYGAIVPDEVLILVAGVDTQDSRLEVTIWGYGRGEESWVIADYVLDGDPDDKGTAENPDVWMRLDGILFAGGFTKASGRTLPVYATCIDSAGHRTDAVYRYCRRRKSKRVYAIVGRHGPGREIIGQSTKKKPASGKRYTEVWTVGSDEAKSIIYARLAMDEPGPGAIHFPVRPEIDENFFKQLTAEVKVPITKNGRQTWKWKMRKGRRRNEKLDNAAYALAALRKVNPNWEAWARRDQTLESRQVHPAAPAERKRPIVRRSKAAQRRVGFVKRGLA